MQKHLQFFTMIIILLIIAGCQTTPKEPIRKIENFGNDWNFKKAVDIHFGTSPWDDATLPHTMRVEPLVVNDQWQGYGWYKKFFEMGDTTGKKFFLHFEGAMHQSWVAVNGEDIAEHLGGYLPFTVDITSYLKPNSKNLVKVLVNNEDNPQVPPGKPLETLDFNYYGGIYRNVYLFTTNNIYITEAVQNEDGGLLVHFGEVDKNQADGIIRVQARNESSAEAIVSYKAKLTSPEGVQFEFISPEFNLQEDEDTELTTEISVAQPELWSPKNPNLYTLEILLLANGKVVDEITEKIGIRKIELNEDGFYVNGEKTYIRGTNRHQEYPYIGYALSDEAQWRDAVKIKNAGFDFVRLSHYPHADAFMEACDELGLMVMNCIAGWQFIGDSTFTENALQDCRELIRRDRNHPCVVFWELSLNESAMTEDFMIRANEILDEELPFEDAYSAGWIDHESYDLFIPARQHAKPPDYWSNYKEDKRNIFVAEYGDWEYYAQNAGFNQKAFADLKEEERTSRQLRGAGEKALLQQALNFQEAANSNRLGKSTIGDANWLMYDYNRGYADDIEASGVSDIFRIPKFAYYFYQSQRPPQEMLESPAQSGPMVFIANFWTENSPTDVRVFSNCEEVELLLNGETIEKMKAVRDSYSSHLPYPPFIFKVDEFEAGTLSAKGYIDGKEVALHEVSSPGKASQIILEADLSGIPISDSTPDVIFVYARVCDENGTIIPDAENLVEFTYEGEGELIGDNPVKAEAGIATVLLKTEQITSPVIISANSEGLKGGELKLY
jgi:beta-galactosidase